MLSNSCKYAIRAVLFLSIKEKENTKIGIKAISSELNIPSPFLGKILQILSKNKLLSSTKGPNGGFSLGKKAEQITILEIVKIIDGLDFFEECIVGLKVCENNVKKKKKCPFYKNLDPVRESLYKQFSTLTIANFKEGLNNKMMEI